MLQTISGIDTKKILGSVALYNNFVFIVEEINSPPPKKKKRFFLFYFKCFPKLHISPVLIKKKPVKLVKFG